MQREKGHIKQSFLVHTLPQEETIKGVGDGKARKELKLERFWIFGKPYFVTFQKCAVIELWSSQFCGPRNKIMLFRFFLVCFI